MAPTGPMFFHIYGLRKSSSSTAATAFSPEDMVLRAIVHSVSFIVVNDLLFTCYTM